MANDFASQFKAHMEQIRRAVQEGAVEGIDDAAQVVLDTKRAEIEKTYDRPVRRLKNGNPASRRTGAWRDGQAIERTSEISRAIVTNGAAANYEGFVAHLPTGPDGVNRSNPAGEVARTKSERLAREAIETALDDSTRSL